MRSYSYLQIVQMYRRYKYYDSLLRRRDTASASHRQDSAHLGLLEAANERVFAAYRPIFAAYRPIFAAYRPIFAAYSCIFAAYRRIFAANERIFEANRPIFAANTPLITGKVSLPINRNIMVFVVKK